jgi:hypothetical protein
MSGVFFSFCRQGGKACKALFLDGNGLILIHKKIERGQFIFFEHIKEVNEINSNELSLILNVLELVSVVLISFSKSRKFPVIRSHFFLVFLVLHY